MLQDRRADDRRRQGAVCRYAPGYGGVAEALFKMCVGNHVGLQLSNDLNCNDLFKPAYGSVILELLDAVRRRVPGLYHRGLHAGGRRRR